MQQSDRLPSVKNMTHSVLFILLLKRKLLVYTHTDTHTPVTACLHSLPSSPFQHFNAEERDSLWGLDVALCMHGNASKSEYVHSKNLCVDSVVIDLCAVTCT